MQKHLLLFKKLLQFQNINLHKEREIFLFSSSKKQISIALPNDLIITAPQKLVALIQSRLGLNNTVFARKCEVQKISKVAAAEFLDTFHLMNSTQSAFNYGLFFKNELLAVAAFSKGRKMNRLPGDKRSFELIRFCCKEGVTVTGGLSKLMNAFCNEKKAGDVMTYIDKEFSSGESFIKAGFVKHSETKPLFFIVNKNSSQRIPLKDSDKNFNTDTHSLKNTKGNIKLIFTPRLNEGV